MGGRNAAPTIPNLLRHATRKFPDHECIIVPGETCTFAEIERRSRRLAKRLVHAGVTKGAHVGVLFPQHPDFIVAFLAITRVGAVAVPLSTFLRPPELRRAVRHADIATLLAPTTLFGTEMQQLFEEVWPELQTTAEPRLFLHDAPFLREIWLIGPTDRTWVTATPDLASLDDEPAIDDALFEAIEHEVTPADRMVIVHTSGATAEPKAVVHTHGAQVRQAQKLAGLYGLTASDRSFTNMPFFWVGGLTVVLLSHMQVGATVIAVQRNDTEQMLDLIEQSRPTRLVGWTLIERLEADPTFAGRDLAWLADVHRQPAVDPAARHNSLGMSETSGPHTAARASENQADLPAELRGSFGPPVAGMEHKVVDPDTGSTLADGLEGEICVRGEGLLVGLHKKERAEVFDADGWYHTGDRGYFRDGLLFFTGRLSEMIKTAGANVAPREVELTVAALPGVKAAFVVGIPDAQRGEVVGCLVCPEDGQEVDPAGVTEQLVPLLSAYKIPRRMLVLPYDEAPWLPSGKIDKARVIELLAASAHERRR
jgi:acyl-CoA synthetase (AMP-forming)/AMP-acid ligase II